MNKKADGLKRIEVNHMKKRKDEGKRTHSPTLIVGLYYTVTSHNLRYPDWATQTKFVTGAKNYFCHVGLSFQLSFPQQRNFPVEFRKKVVHRIGPSSFR